MRMDRRASAAVAIVRVAFGFVQAVMNSSVSCSSETSSIP